MAGERRKSPTFRACDPNIYAKAATTTCAFAENAFYEYYESSGKSALRVYSPAMRASFATTCTPGEGVIVCTTHDGGVAKFSQASIDRYTDAEASRYAASPQIGPASDRTSGGDASSGYGGDNSYDESDAYDTSPPSSSPPAASTYGGGSSDFCTTHDCIPNYDSGNGYTVQCADGMYSHSGGVQGACSGHGGEG